MSKSPRWTSQLIREARGRLDGRVNQVVTMSPTQLRAELHRVLGFTPDPSVSDAMLRRWLIGASIESCFPDSPSPAREEAKPQLRLDEPTMSERRNIGL